MTFLFLATDDKQICHVLMKPALKPEPKRSELAVEVQKHWQEIPREQLHKDEEPVKGYFGINYKGMWPFFTRDISSFFDF